MTRLLFTLLSLLLLSFLECSLSSSSSKSSPKYAYVTILSSTSNEFYIKGLISLATMLQSLESKYPHICLISEPYKPAHEDLKKIGNYIVKYMDSIENPYKEHLKQYSTVFSKLHLWSLEEYDKVLYLDADILVVKNLDHLFERDIETIAATSDTLLPDRFSSGVLLLKPNLNVFSNMTKILNSNQLDSYDKADQGFLNSYFSDWYTTATPAHRLPYGYNVDQVIVDLYDKAYKYIRDRNEVYVYHFTSEQMKPWNIRTNNKKCPYETAVMLHLWELSVILPFSGSTANVPTFQKKNDFQKLIQKEYIDYCIFHYLTIEQITNLFMSDPIQVYSTWLQNFKVNQKGKSDDETEEKAEEITVKTYGLTSNEKDAFYLKNNYGSIGIHFPTNSTSSIKLQQLSNMKASCLPGVIPIEYQENVHIKVAPDAPLRQFLEKFFPTTTSIRKASVLLAFDSLPWPHKGDLWRYCWLYVTGGIYLDIKTIPSASLSETFVSASPEEKNIWYTVVSHHEWPHVHNGIIASIQPQNPILLNLIQAIINTRISHVKKKYEVFINQIYQEVLRIYELPKTHIRAGIYHPKQQYKDQYWSLVLLEERCDRRPLSKECQVIPSATKEKKLDRYGLCCNVYDTQNQVVFHTRHLEYPWKQCMTKKQISDFEMNMKKKKLSNDYNYFKTALAYHQENQLEQAREFYELLLQEFPNHNIPDAYNNLAILLKNIGQDSEAKRIWNLGWKRFESNKLLKQTRLFVFQDYIDAVNTEL